MKVGKLVIGIGALLLSWNTYAELSDNYDYVRTEIYEIPKIGMSDKHLNCVKARVAVNNSNDLLENFLLGQRLDYQGKLKNEWFGGTVGNELALIPNKSLFGIHDAGCVISRGDRFVVYGRDVYRKLNGDYELSYYIVRALSVDDYFDLPLLPYFIATVSQYEIEISHSISLEEANELLREAAHINKEKRDKWLEDRREYCFEIGQTDWSGRTWRVIPKRVATNDCMSPVVDIIDSIDQQ